jgi:hypothetical protein
VEFFNRHREDEKRNEEGGATSTTGDGKSRLMTLSLEYVSSIRAGRCSTNDLEQSTEEP